VKLHGLKRVKRRGGECSKRVAGLVGVWNGAMKEDRRGVNGGIVQKCAEGMVLHGQGVSARIVEDGDDVGWFTRRCTRTDCS
jgi:hypothetical protein